MRVLIMASMRKIWNLPIAVETLPENFHLSKLRFIRAQKVASGEFGENATRVASRAIGRRICTQNV
jgi:hypothetical protein